MSANLLSVFLGSRKEYNRLLVGQSVGVKRGIANNLVRGDCMHKNVRTISSSKRRVVIALVLIAGLWIPSNAFGSEIKVLCTQALTGAMEKLGPQFERETGNKLVIGYGATGGILNRFKNGEAADVVIVTAPALDTMVKLGKIVAPGGTAIAQTGVGLAIRRGAPRPDISSAEALKRTLLAAKSIAYSDPAGGGVSGIVFAQVVEKLGIAEQLKPKTKLVPAGRSSGALAASGEVEIAVQMISELMPVAGAEVVGPLPPGLQSLTVFSAGVSAGAANPAAAKRLILFLSSPAATPVLREAGLEPAK
jgi:molybdate transport system substrate-binding protein